MNYNIRNLKSNEQYRSDISESRKDDFLQKDFDPPRREFLPEGFVPGVFDVIVGRGRKCNMHAGNNTLCRIIKSNLEEYSASSCKIKKSNILLSIMSHVRTNGGFVKEDSKTKRWYDVGDKLAREKISQMFRNELHEKYRSSALSKKHKRMEKKTYNYWQTQNQDVQYHIDRIRQLCDQRKHLGHSQNTNMNTVGHEPAFDLSSAAEEISAEKLLSDNENLLPLERISLRTYQITDNPFEPTPILEDGPSLLKSNTAWNRKGNDFF